MERAITAWKQTYEKQPSWLNSFTQKLHRSYVVYGSMILLPSTAYDELDRKRINTLDVQLDLEQLYELIAQHLKITHVASTRPIPLHDDDQTAENVLRAPKNFTPLYGDFGSSTCHDPPAQEDYDAAYWVTAKQNGIFQTWAPRWTMFSRGNISEKARLLTLPSVLSAVEDGEADGKECVAVDLYAGIGYFTFSYLKAGVSKVLCWDINPWSIEGLMRGAKANKWFTRRITNDASFTAALESDARLLVFNEDNTMARRRIDEARQSLPPIRHVNCGLLPTSQGSWDTAVNVLDQAMGGWIHVHENFATSEIEQKAEEVRQELQRLAEGRVGLGSSQPVKVEHINRLKSYAPGVMHCVVDIYIPPLIPT